MIHHQLISPQYTAMMLVGLVVGGLLWSRRISDRPEMVIVLATGLIGALVGAKLGYIVSEVWFLWGDEHFWQNVLVGKTVLGALLGGYAGVELGKRFVGHRAATGDAFAIAVPVGLVFGRVGCLMHGCCRGLSCDHNAWWAVADSAGRFFYPAAAVELVFNLAMAAILLLLRRAGRYPGNLFHGYMIAYGLFRLAHEPLRATPKLIPGISGYSLLAIALIAIGAARGWQRARQSQPELTAA